MRLPSNWMFLILKSMPMVVMNVGENESLAYLSNRQVFPTPEKYKVSIKYWVVDVLSFCLEVRNGTHHYRRS